MTWKPTRHFDFLGEHELIFIMDIKSLCTVIPNGEGLLALKHFFDKPTLREPSSETPLRLGELELTLMTNFFHSGQLLQADSWCSHGYQNGTQLRLSVRWLYWTPITLSWVAESILSFVAIFLNIFRVGWAIFFFSLFSPLFSLSLSLSLSVSNWQV